MAALPEIILPTVEKIFKQYEEKNGDHRRDHLGASLIGKPCERALWYTFMWCSNPKFSGRMLRLFETGIQQEARIIKNLRSIGVTVYDVHPDTGRQIHYESFGGHFSGSLDGIAVGFQESKVYHVCEFKTANTKTFNSLKKHGVEKTKPEHFCQMQVYMHWAGLERAFYFCINKETDDIYAERIHLNKEIVSALLEKAERIIFSATPTHRASDDKDKFECKWCEHRSICHEGKLPDVSCRTCAFANPETLGKWRCTRDDKILCGMDQRKACERHVFIPQLVPLEQTDADPDKGTITYSGNITNGPGAIPSTKMQEAICLIMPEGKVGRRNPQNLF